MSNPVPRSGDLPDIPPPPADPTPMDECRMRMGAANEHIKAALDALSLECAANVHWGFVAVMLRSAGVELSMAADYADECDDLDMGVSVDTPLVEVDERPEPFLPSPDHVCDKGGEA